MVVEISPPLGTVLKEKRSGGIRQSSLEVQ